MNKPFHLTQRGVDELKAELEDLQAQRSDIAERIKSAREFGDLGENMEYTAARQDQERNENRITEIEHILQNAQIITEPKNDDVVELGNTVKLKSENGKTKEFQVVGTVEADPLEGKISDESPLGQAVLGKKKGDEVEIKTPSETAVYKVVDIN